MNLLAHKKLLFAGGAAFLVLILITLAFFLSGSSPQPSPTPSTVPSASPLSAEDRALITKLSGELAAKYHTYTRPDAPEYLAGIKPYVADSFYQTTRGEIDKYRGRLPNARPASGTAGEVKFVKESTDSVTVEVQVDVSSGGGAPSRNVSTIKWTRQGDRWIADYLLDSTSLQNEQKYAE